MRLWKFASLFVVSLVFVLLTGSAATAQTGPYADWYAEYYSNQHLAGSPVAVVPEVEIDNNWGYLSPRQGVPSDYFSVRWSANIEFEGGEYTFLATVDDGVRLWIDGVIIIDEWDIHSATTFTRRVYIPAGTHHVQMAYFEATGQAVAKLTWQHIPPGEDPVKVIDPPSYSSDLVIDNTDPGFTWGGSTQYRYTAAGGQGSNYYWTYNTTTHPVNYGRWTPHFPGAGEYEVYVYIPHQYATTTNLRYRILHNGYRTDKIISQFNYSNQWVSLGTYYFNGHNDNREFVLAYDNTREEFGSRYIAFDAVKFERRH